MRDARVHKNFVLLKLSGVEDRTAAEALRGRELLIRRSDAQLPAGKMPRGGGYRRHA